MKNIRALYGSFNMYMHPLEVIDVTTLLKPFLKDDLLTIPKDFFKKEFENTPNSKDKFLQIFIDDKIINILHNEYFKDIQLNFSYTQRIKIIYYLYINPNTNWQAFISSQLLQLKSYGILSEADLYIHITDCHNLADQVMPLIKQIAPNSIISLNHENLYEYPGIKLVHDLAIQFPSDIFIYFHAKGIGHNAFSRDQKEIALFTATFKNWRKNIQQMQISNKQKMGVFPGILSLNNKDEVKKGWIWYNYWYANGEYLSKCPKPIITADRYYYEGWLSLTNQTKQSDDCISLYQINNINKTYFEPTEADFHFLFLMGKTSTFFQRIIIAIGNKKIGYYYFKLLLSAKSLKRKYQR